ncbi:MAG TPA: aldolase/citrate lyase family protein [Bacteroidota bacterium]|nr:aldolase/citrate lyase family protein [Bacteroidota bacterium]
MSSPIQPNRLRQIFQSGGAAVGTMLVEIRQPAVMQLMANGGFDFVIIDNEHGPFDIETIADLSRMARLVGITPIVRVPDLTYAEVTRPLDAGAQGIMVPRIVGPEQVREAVQMMKYPPTGRRGSVMARGHTEFKGGDVSQMMSDSNRETMLVVQIETRQALDRIDEILSVEGVDVGFVGPNDLSIALGVAGKLESDPMNQSVAQVVQACRKHRVIPAIQANELSIGLRWAAAGMRMLSYNSEAGLMVKSASDATTALKKEFSRS